MELSDAEKIQRGAHADHVLMPLINGLFERISKIEDRLDKIEKKLLKIDDRHNIVDWLGNLKQP